MEPNESLWAAPPPVLELLNNDIHIWRASFDQKEACFKQLKQTLSSDELQRAEKFHFEHDRKNFIVGRGILRTIISYYLGIEPDRLSFKTGSHGKPSLSKAATEDSFCFNLSHSKGLLLFAITRQQEIGIDIEFIHPISDMDQIAERFFSPRENALYRSIQEDRKIEAFFKCWTRKEAFIKAIGEGLSYPLDQFDVSFLPGEPARLLAVKGDNREASEWLLQDIDAAPGYAAALAVRRHGGGLSYWKWENRADS